MQISKVQKEMLFCSHICGNTYLPNLFEWGNTEILKTAGQTHI